MATAVMPLYAQVILFFPGMRTPPSTRSLRDGEPLVPDPEPPDLLAERPPPLRPTLRGVSSRPSSSRSAAVGEIVGGRDGRGMVVSLSVGAGTKSVFLYYATYLLFSGLVSDVYGLCR